MPTLKEKIIATIRAEGPINFETFMDMALYYPGLGYYTRESTRIGSSGDFYTSPHLHPLFGAMIGKQMEEMWHCLGRPERFQVVEMGAGMGHIAKDMLDFLSGGVRAREKQFFQHLAYTIVELNPAVKARQQELLSGFLDKVAWIRRLEELEPVVGCFLSNELLDAFPVRVVEREEELMEIYVTVSERDREGSTGEKGLEEVRMPGSREVRDYFREFSLEIPKGFRTEVNLKIKEWLREVEDKLSEGFILTIDYGYPSWDYYHEDRHRGTLLCYYRHQINENPYEHIGEQDLTAHVNFSSLKKWGEEIGLRTLGFCPQGTYLISLGMDEVIDELSARVSDALDTAKIKGLILPQGMGESHKVMVQYKGDGEPRLKGFGLRNRERNL